MLEQMFGLKGKVALVTGGASGIGRAMAEAFLAADAERVYIASRKAAALEAAAAEISPEGRCLPLVADLGSVEGCRALASEIAGREPSLHILVNNSGAGWSAPFDAFPESGWDKVFQINLKAPFFLVQALAEQLAAAGTQKDPARVLNIGSVAGQIDNGSGTYPYGLAKRAVHHATAMLALELAPRWITVNAIAPGRIGTKMTQYVAADADRFAQEIEMIPLHRYGEPQEIAALGVYLASPSAAYVTGSVVTVDGGLRLLHPFDMA